MQIHLQKKNFNEAEVAYTNMESVLRELQPERVFVLRPALVALMCEKKDFDGAQQVVDALGAEIETVDDAFRPVYDFAKGYLEFKRGNAAAAIHDLEIAARAQPNFATRYALGEAYLEAGLLAEAVKEFEGLLDRYSEDRAATPNRLDSPIKIEMYQIGG